MLAEGGLTLNQHIPDVSCLSYTSRKTKDHLHAVAVSSMLSGPAGIKRSLELLLGKVADL